MENKFFLTILVMIFSDVLMFYQIFLSPQVKRIVIISNEHGILFYSLVPSLPPRMKIFSILTKNVQKLKLNFSRTALFHTSTKVFLIYFGVGCS